MSCVTVYSGHTTLLVCSPSKIKDVSRLIASASNTYSINVNWVQLTNDILGFDITNGHLVLTLTPLGL